MTARSATDRNPSWSKSKNHKTRWHWRMAFESKTVGRFEVGGIATIVLSVVVMVGVLYSIW